MSITASVIAGPSKGSAQEQSVVGETPNLATRLQAIAKPNAVVIAAATRRLVGDLFEYHDLGVDVIIAGSVSDEQAREKYPGGWKAPKPYLRIVPQPN